MTNVDHTAFGDQAGQLHEPAGTSERVQFSLKLPLTLRDGYDRSSRETDTVKCAL